MALRVWLPLTDILENKGCSNLIFTNTASSGITTNSAGKIGSCYYRASAKSAGRIESNTTITLNGDISMCCWAKVTATVGDTANGLVSNHSHANNTGFGICVKQVSSTDYRISCSTGNGSNRTYCTYYGTSNIKDSWHHLALTYNNTTHIFQLWVDGVVEKTQSYTNSARADKIRLFDWSTTYDSNDYKPACFLNDVRIYDHCLSAAEVHEISQGLVLHYKLDSLPYNFSTNTITSFTNFTIGQYYYTIFSINMTDFLSRTGAVNGDKFTFSVDINAASNTKNLAARVQHFNSSSDRTNVMGNYITPGSSGRSSITFTINTAYTRLDFMITNGDSGSVTANSTEQYKCTRIEKGDVHTGYVPTGITPYIQDSSGYGHNGTPAFIDRFSMTSDTPRYNASTVFSGSNSRIGSSKDLYFDKNYGTVACWFNYAENSSASHWLFAINSGNGGASDCAFGLYSNSNKFNFCAAGNAKTKSFADEDVVNKWNHAAITYNNGIGKCYLNGILFYTATDLTQLTDRVGFCIGGRLGTSSYTFHGMISDVRVYCTPLSDNDIKQLYEMGGKVDNKQNLHIYEAIEMQPTIKLTKQGQMKAGEFQEDTATKLYKTDQIVETNNLIEF